MAEIKTIGRQSLTTKMRQLISYRSGDSGDFLQVGNPITPRLNDIGDGTVFDRATGLMWVKDHALIIPGEPNVHSTNMIQVARGDWTNGTAYAQADLVKDVVDSTYWICAVAHTSAVAGTFANDRAGHPDYWRQTVWVREASSLGKWAFIDWNTAIDESLGTDYGGNFEYAGYSDWRLPNFKELVSLYDLSRDNSGWLDSDIFTHPNLTGRYWSSNTKFGTANAYYVNFAVVIIYSVAKTYSNWMVARPVRLSNWEEYGNLGKRHKS